LISSFFDQFFTNHLLRIMNKYMLRPIAASIFAGFVAAANAQFVDDVEVRQEGVNAVIEVKFVTPVLYSKSISARASDLVQ